MKRRAFLKGVPLATVAKACAVAGETIVLRGGVFRETLRPATDGVTIRAMPGGTKWHPERTEP